MAVFTLHKELMGNSQVFNLFPIGFFVVSEGGEKPKSFTIQDNIGGKIVYTGTGFTYGDEGPTGGTVTKIRFIDYLGEEVMTITEAKVDLADLDLNDTRANFAIFEKGSKTFNGSDGDDRIVFENGTGNDTVNAMGGADYIEASAGKNAYDGGAGKDHLTYQQIFTKGITVDLLNGEITNPYGKVDTVKNVEQVTGTAYSDVFIGSDKADKIDGFAGDDTVTGGKGGDTFMLMYNGGVDIYKDFGKGADKFFLSNTTTSFDEVMEKATQVGKNVEIDFGLGDKIIIQKYDIDNLTSDQFDGYFFT